MITPIEIEAMLSASPGSTPESLAAGFEKRAQRRFDAWVASGIEYVFDVTAQAEDIKTADALRAYAAESARCASPEAWNYGGHQARVEGTAEARRLLEAAQRAGDNATARAIVQACEVLGLETIGGAL